MRPAGGRLSYGRRIGRLAAEHPEATAVVWARADGSEESLSWRALDEDSNRIARLLRDRGVDTGSRVVVALGNTMAHYPVTTAVWKLGACVIPLKADLPPAEREALLGVIDPVLVIGDVDAPDRPVLTASRLAGARLLPEDPLPDRTAQPGKAVCSGGSTGRPKVIFDPRPWAFAPGEFSREWSGVGCRPGHVQLVTGPLYHNMPFVWSSLGLFDDHRVILMERFDAGRAVELVETHRVTFLATVPTVLNRIIKVPRIAERDLSGLEAVMHSAAPCPRWLKQAWIDLIGPDRLHEAFGATEAVGRTQISGEEWLRHPGSVGRAHGCEIRILGPDGALLPPGETGEIYMRPLAAGPTYAYAGAEAAPSDEEGFVSVGDLGRLDEDGYLYVADRRTDLIITGGANVYPAEVEAVLTEHPAVADAVVIGVRDPDWGRRVHALIQWRDPDRPLTAEDLTAFVRERVAAYKVPKSYEFLPVLPRDDAGKIRRSALLAERETATERGATPHTISAE